MLGALLQSERSCSFTEQSTTGNTGENSLEEKRKILKEGFGKTFFLISTLERDVKVTVDLSQLYLFTQTLQR